MNVSIACMYARTYARAAALAAGTNARCERPNGLRSTFPFPAAPTVAGSLRRAVLDTPSSEAKNLAEQWSPDLRASPWPGSPVTWIEQGGQVITMPLERTPFIAVGDNWTGLYQAGWNAPPPLPP